MDTGIRVVKGEPVICLCAKGQSDEALKEYRKIIEKRKLLVKKKEFEKKRVIPEMIIKYECDKCHDTGFVTPDGPVGSEMYGKAVPCVCRADARKKAQEAIFVKLCQLPDARPEWTIDTYKPRPGCEEMLEAAISVAENNGLKWVTFISPSGYGKTHLAVGICRKWLEKGKSARYIYVPDLVMELKQGFDDDGINSYRAKMNFFKNVSLLALDDLGTENPTSWVCEQLDTIIDYRYVNKLPLVVTTNKPLETLNPRIANRLKRIELDGIGKVVFPSQGCVSYLDYVKKRKAL